MTSIKTAPKVLLTPKDQPVIASRDPGLRINDYYEVYEPADAQQARREGKRCMNCGAAFCMPDSGYGAGCPIYNKIPEWNELVELDRWHDAYNRLSLTNPFPEFTARVCPAPCQDACIVGINDKPVQIKGIERSIIDRAFDEGWVQPVKPDRSIGEKIAIIGSGPAGLAAADRLNRIGYQVTVYERSDRAGGLLMYGVPNMKLDKAVVDRRIGLMVESGIVFKLGVDIGSDIDPQQLVAEHDAVLLACGSLRPRDLDLPGRALEGIHQAMPYLTESTRALASAGNPSISARGRHVVVIGAGDTGTDCIGTALRQGARSVINLSRGDAPPTERDADHPWPDHPGTLQTDYAHAEAYTLSGSDPRYWDSPPIAFEGDAADQITGVVIDCPERGRRVLQADLVILSIGFTGHDSDTLLQRIGLTNNAWDPGTASIQTATQHKRVFVAGDIRRGSSLVVHAIAEGIAAARQINTALSANR